jgi:hypothetical protein
MQDQRERREGERREQDRNEEDISSLLALCCRLVSLCSWSEVKQQVTGVLQKKEWQKALDGQKRSSSTAQTGSTTPDIDAETADELKKLQKA